MHISLHQPSGTQPVGTQALRRDEERKKERWSGGREKYSRAFLDECAKDVGSNSSPKCEVEQEISSDKRDFCLFVLWSENFRGDL